MKYKRMKSNIYFGLTPNKALNIDWSKLKKQFAVDTSFGFKDVWYIDQDYNKQIRTELWEFDIDNWKLVNVCGIKDNERDGECIHLKW